MATMKHPPGKSSTVETISANASGSTSTVMATGPKQTNTYGKGRGVYIMEISGTYRWVRDEPIGAFATEPTVFTAGD